MMYETIYISMSNGREREREIKLSKALKSKEKHCKYRESIARHSSANIEKNKAK